MSYIYIWQFKVAKGRGLEFERAYGPDGDWVRLFRRSKGYVRTTLIRDIKESSLYITIDEWESRDYFQKFKEKFQADYSKLDLQFSSLTESEILIGEYEGVQ